ncbi:uncharacterized protein LOC141837322 [Curcuma longa]|uniref:uncharacterized protein LOC141837322 n=1 Tax=Curcuma longa TaxID=136217 RepID=UPI003D9F9978
MLEDANSDAQKVSNKCLEDLYELPSSFPENSSHFLSPSRRHCVSALRIGKATSVSDPESSADDDLAFESAFGAIESRISCSEKTLGVMEESHKQLHELIRRNEEKRLAIHGLWTQIEGLKKENRALLERNSKLMERKMTTTGTVNRTQSSSRPWSLSVRSASFSKLKHFFSSKFSCRSIIQHEN